MVEFQIQSLSDSYDNYPSLSEQSNQDLAMCRYILEQVTHITSHNLKESVRTIDQFLGKLHKHLEDPNEESKRYLGYVKSSVGQMHQLINGLHEISKLSTSEPKSTIVELQPLVNSVLSDLHYQIASANASVRLGSLPSIFGDQSLIYQIITHLIQNSVKFRSPDRPCRIEIISSSPSQDSKVFIDIKDNSIGIPRRCHKRIFNLFEQLHDRDEYEGSGLGLTVCKVAAAKLGGAITCHESIENIGTTMRVTLNASVSV